MFAQCIHFTLYKLAALRCWFPNPSCRTRVNPGCLSGSTDMFCFISSFCKSKLVLVFSTLLFGLLPSLSVLSQSHTDFHTTKFCPGVFVSQWLSAVPHSGQWRRALALAIAWEMPEAQQVAWERLRVRGWRILYGTEREPDHSLLWKLWVRDKVVVGSEVSPFHPRCPEAPVGCVALSWFWQIRALLEWILIELVVLK